MELNERKIRILEYIINDYIATAEPVGSRTIAKKYDMGLSSATIRNEMSDLEEMGYILAPHASAGRVPSDMGYRLFVDRLLRRRAQAQHQDDVLNRETDALRFLERVIARNINQIDYLMRETAKAISLLTKYTAVVSEAVSAGDRVGRLQLMPLDENCVLLVTVTVSRKVKNHSIRAVSIPGYEELINMSRALNTELIDATPAGLTPAAKKRLKTAFTGYEPLLTAVLSAVTGVLNDGADQQVYTSGIKNILAFPEFYDNSKARALFEALEERDYLKLLLEESAGRNAATDVSVVIGQENALLELRDCSIVKTTYRLDGDVSGGIAIIGPTRMDYSQAVSVLQSMAKHINSALRALEEGKD
ncbi:MAG: heat-inducible transcriptional repressor HrcA [Defluviitaleaceae bacterium]|nr:heat-inducible transcriptional repressor HrcA [Defluviitaleaceae bacterium]MCL2836486.1 heat-inducible transcriptional repressor HrcA [Defluviitaleaceae bacterium]